MADLIVKSTYLESGFYNSVSGDRKYTAEQMGRLVDGIISEGVFPNVGEAFEITWGSSLESLPYRRLTIGTGKAWLSNKWIFNKNVETFDLSELESGYYYLYLVLNLSKAGRKAEFIISDEDITPPDNIISNVVYYKMAYIIYNHDAGINRLFDYVGDENGALPFVTMNVLPEENDHEEIVNARVGFDGTHYDSLGDSVRGQYNSINSRVNRVEDAAYYHVWNSGGSSSATLNFQINDIVYVDTPLSNGNYGYFVCLYPVLGSTLEENSWERYWAKLTISNSISDILRTIKYGPNLESLGYVYSSSVSGSTVSKGTYVLLEKAIGTTPAGLYKAIKDNAALGAISGPSMNTYFIPTSILFELRKIFKNDWSKIHTQTLTNALGLGEELTVTLNGENSSDNLKIVLTNPGAEVTGLRLSILYSSSDGLTDQKAFYDGSNVSFPANGYLYSEIETVDDMKHTLSCRANGGSVNKYLHANNPGKIESVKFKVLTGGTAGLPAGTTIEIYGKNNISNVL